MNNDPRNLTTNCTNYHELVEISEIRGFSIRKCYLNFSGK